jgi:glycosyltransferase involved in cell wall biosynthesis
MTVPYVLRETGPATEPPPTAPIVSIVTATYGRPQVLGFAIESVLAQDFQDWELIVVGDGCRDETETVVSRFNDPRIRFHNLPFNYGEQSGPNNVGLRRARGRYVAFLNQDDLWFPDHLSLAVAWLEATAADIVLMMGGSFAPDTMADVVGGRWLIAQVNRGRDGWYDPATTNSVVSTHVVDRRVYDQIGYWRPAVECEAISSDDFILRAWRRGFAIRCAPYLSVMVFSSGSRRNSYVSRDASEQEYFWKRLRADPGRLRLAIVDSLSRSEPRPPAFLRRLSLAGLRFLARLGVPIRERRVRRALGVRRGAYINYLRRNRGLSPIPSLSPGLSEMRSRYRSEAGRYRLGELIVFSAAGNGFLVCGEGWSHAEAWGRWSDGPTAELVFHLADPPTAKLVLTVEAQAFLHDRHTEQTVDVAINGVDAARWIFQRGSSTPERRIEVPELPAGDTTVIVTFRVRSPRSPKEVGLSKDKRRLGLGICRAMIAPPPDG